MPSLDGESILAAIAALDKKFDAKLGEQKVALDRIGNDSASLHVKVDGAIVRIASLEQDNVEAKRKLREVATGAARHVSESDLKHHADMAATVTHVEKHREQVEASLAKQNRVDQAICAELGLDYEEVASSGDSIPPGGKKRKRTTLAKIASENKVGIGATGATIVLVILQIVQKILEHH